MRWFSTLCLFAATTGFLAAEDKKADDEKMSAKIRAIGLTLRKPLPAKPGAFAYTPNGVTMDLVVTQPGKFLVALDTKESKLDSFTDDKKNNLYKKAGLFGGSSEWISGYLTQFSPDGEQCTLQITAANPPGKGAEKILVKASLVLKCGSEEKTTDKKEIALKTNEEVSVGDFKMKVNSAAQFGAGLAVQSAEPNVKSIEFFDADGKALKLAPGGRSTNNFAPGGKPLSFVSYFLNQKMDKVSFKITYFNKIESVTVPVDLRVGLDLE